MESARRTTSAARCALLVALALALATTARLAQAQTYPTIPTPYSTTLLRTHHYAAERFLSVGELLSVNTTADGHVWEAYMIAPGWPFDLRDDPTSPTVVLGLRVVYEYTATNYTIWYYATDLSGEEDCILYGTYPYRPFTPSAQGAAVIRGIDTTVWVDTDPSSGVVTTHYLTPDLDNAQYPFRIHVAYPEGSSEVEWTLDHGTHYALLQTPWFATGNCDRVAASAASSSMTRRARPQPHNPWLLL